MNKIFNKYSNVEIIDLTSKSDTKFVKLSPFYPVGNIPIPFSEGHFGSSVEGIWQGLKVFEYIGIDKSKFLITNMKNIKRTTMLNGKILGHQRGIFSDELLTYRSARQNIFANSYNWTMQFKLETLMAELIQTATVKDIVFLDYNTNENIDDLSHPLSHASLVKNYIISKTKLYKNPQQLKFTFE